MSGTDTKQMIETAIERRGVIQRAGLGALGLGALASAGVSLPTRSASAQMANIDVDVLNFALNLEYLEAEYYLRAVTGQGLADADRTGGQGQAPGTVSAPDNTKVYFPTGLLRQYAQDIANDEQAHVRFLRSALGSAAIPEPTIDVGQAFTTLAQAAGLIGPGQTFNPYNDEISFLVGAFIFEDVGVTAYAGAAGLITDKGYLGAAASILAVEAYHAGTIRTILAEVGAGDVTDAIANLRSTLSAGAPNIDDAGTKAADGTVILAPVDANSLAFRRTTRQVLNIVYGAPNAASGLFFPNGLNGTITS